MLAVAPHVHMTAAPRAAAPGGRVALLVHNPTRQLVEYGLPVRVQRRLGGDWVPATTDVFGTDHPFFDQPLLHASPHDVGRYSLDRVQLPPSIAAGRYRFSRTVRVRSRGARTLHAAFRVHR